MVTSKCGNWSFGRDEQYYKASRNGDTVVVGNKEFVDFVVDQYQQMYSLADSDIQRKASTYSEFKDYCKWSTVIQIDQAAL
jgi:hypothetical protein